MPGAPEEQGQLTPSPGVSHCPQGAVPIPAGCCCRDWHEAGPLMLRTGQGRAAARCGGQGPLNPLRPSPSHGLLTGPCWKGGGHGLLEPSLYPVPIAAS